MSDSLPPGQTGATGSALICDRVRLRVHLNGLNFGLALASISLGWLGMRVPRQAVTSLAKSSSCLRPLIDTTFSITLPTRSRLVHSFFAASVDTQAAGLSLKRNASWPCSSSFVLSFFLLVIAIRLIVTMRTDTPYGTRSTRDITCFYHVMLRPHANLSRDIWAVGLATGHLFLIT